MREQAIYSRRTLELRAAEYYASIRKPKSKWQSIDDVVPQLTEFEHRIQATDYDGAANILHTLNMQYLFKWGYYNKLRELWEQVLGKVKDVQVQSKVLGGLGVVYYSLGQSEKAIQFHKKALSIARAISYRKGESFQLGRLGIIYRNLGKIALAREYYETSLNIALEIDNQTLVGFRLGGLGTICLALGQHKQALEFYQQSIAIAREKDDRWNEGIRLGGIGRVYQNLGNYDTAKVCYTEALKIAEEIGDRQRKSDCLRELARLCANRGQLDEALELCREGLSVAYATGHRYIKCMSLVVLARICLMHSAILEAEQCSIEAKDLMVFNTTHQAMLIFGIVQLHKQNPEAITIFSEVIVCCESMLEKTAGLYEVRYALAAALVGQAVSNPRWTNASYRPSLLDPVLAEYRRALITTAASGIVHEALRDLELIRATGIEGLEPVFELLEGALNEPA